MAKEGGRKEGLIWPPGEEQVLRADRTSGLAGQKKSELARTTPLFSISKPLKRSKSRHAATQREATSPRFCLRLFPSPLLFRKGLSLCRLNYAIHYLPCWIAAANAGLENARGMHLTLPSLRRRLPTDEAIDTTLSTYHGEERRLRLLSSLEKSAAYPMRRLLRRPPLGASF